MSLTKKTPEQIDAELLGPLTEAQRACVQCFGRPLVVSAGAGSGKTFMLTRRIAYALAHPELSGVESIDQVLAITFTTLAAGEIKARVRSTLRSVGMIEQAALVDSCWISTIHGMCSRMLHEHALELGLDPQFGLIDDVDAEKLRTEAVNETIASVSQSLEDGESGTDDAFAQLFASYGESVKGESVKDMVGKLLDAAASVPDGLDALDFGPQAQDPHDIARKVYDALVSVNAVTREMDISASGKHGGGTAWAGKMFGITMQEHGMSAFERLMADRELTYERLAQEMGALVSAIKDADVRATTKDVKEPNRAFRMSLDEAYLECAFGITGGARDELVTLTRRVHDAYEAKKRQLGVLDTNDLLLKTLGALRENRCGIADEYRDRFKLVLVDEFQDTSDLQIDIVSFLDGHDHERLCTVGDAQQSIYSFRGADVKTYLRFKGEVKELGGELRQLDKNYRSHGDVIQFVNTVFGQPQVFGGADSEFIKLDWDHDHAAHNEYAATGGRIGVIMTTNPRGVRGHKAPSRDDRLLLEAAQIAETFQAIHDKEPRGGTNRSWNDMVILLGTMKDADTYASALRGRGIPCVIAGGSIFDQTPEAQLVHTLVCALANPLDDSYTSKVLAGPLFGLSPAELLTLAQAGVGSYWRGIQKLARKDGRMSARLALAVGTLADAQAMASSAAPSQALMHVLTAAGWLERMRKDGPEGLAAAANALKAVRMVEDMEADPHAPRGIASVAARVRTKFKPGMMKEAPGALNTQGGGAVRIMTIHASKGLEFPVVALGAFYAPGGGSSKLLVQTAGRKVRVSLEPNPTADKSGLLDIYGYMKADYDKQLKSMAALEGGAPQRTVDECEGAWEFVQALQENVRHDELAEMRRKFYVGATRPREALVMAISCNSLAASNAKVQAGAFYSEDIIEDVRQALCPSTDFESTPAGYDFGGEQRAWCRRYRLDKDQSTGTVFVQDLDVGDGQKENVPLGELLADMLEAANPEASEKPQADATVMVPEYVNAEALAPVAQPCDPLRAGAFSYSSVAPAAEDACDPDEVPAAGQPAADGESEPFAGRPSPAARRGADPTAFGSAFHLAAQLMAETRTGVGVPDVPADARLQAALRTWGVPASQLSRLRDALALWAASDAAARAYAHPCAQAEAPLCALIPGPDGEPLHLEGAIDLLCFDPAAPAEVRRAYVVDYKTGGSATETPEELRAKHLLQAQCYAYAVLRAGCAGVDLTFVRVEQPDADRPGRPQEVTYSFERSQVQELSEAIRAAYAGRPRA